MKIGTAFIEVRAQTTGFASQVQAESARAGNAAGTMFSQSWASSAKRVGATLTKTVTLPMAVGFGLALREAEQADRAGRQTVAVLKSTGGAANVSAQGVGNLADRLGKIAAVDNDVVRMGVNWLLTFKNIKNTGADKLFDRTAEAGVNLAATLAARTGGSTGDNISGAMTLLGKAVNDPIKGLMALNRAGVTFSKTQKEQITAMATFGNVAGAQKAILAEVESQTSGAAKAGATGFQRFKTQVGDFAEELGTKAMPIAQRFLGVAEGLMDAFMGMPDWAQDFVIGGAAVAAAVGPFARVAGSIAQIAGAGGGGGIKNLFSGWSGAALGIGAVALGIGALIERTTTGEKKMNEFKESILRATDAEIVRQWTELNKSMSFWGTVDAGGRNQSLEEFGRIARENFPAAVRLFDALRASGQEMPGFAAALDAEAAAQRRSGEATAGSAAATWAHRDAVNAFVYASQAQSLWLMAVAGQLPVTAGAVRDTTGAVIGYNTQWGLVPAVKHTTVTADASQGIAEINRFIASMAGIGPAAAAAAAAAGPLAGIGVAIGLAPLTGGNF